MNAWEATGRILIVEDEVANINFLRHLLKDEYSLLIEKTGEDGLARAKRERPDLILLDVVLPDINGFQVMAALKASEATRDIPVIYVTSVTDVADEDRGFYLGAVDYIEKPLNAAMIRARVRTHMRLVRLLRIHGQLGMVDLLTQLPNRRGFESRVALECARATREKEEVGMILLKTDLPAVDEPTGTEPGGESRLRAISRLILSHLKRPADFLAHLGGGEFALLLPKTGLDGVRAVLQGIRASAAASDWGASPDAPSGGLRAGAASLFPVQGCSHESLIAAAEEALYAGRD